MPDDRSSCLQGATNETRIDALEKRQTIFEATINEIKDELLNRPSPAFVAILSTITTLLGIAIGIAVTLATMLHKFSEMKG